MIISKPKKTTLFSLGIFLIMVFAVILYNYKSYYESAFTSYLNLGIIIVLFPIGVGISIKILVGYKIITAGKNKISIRFPLRFIGYEINLKDIVSWKEKRIKTFNSSFHELEIRSSTGKSIRLSKQEHTDYEKILNYLSKKCRNKRVET